MMTVGVREFKNRATELLRIVESGEDEIIITRHSRPIAKLVLPGNARHDPEEAILDRLAAAGTVRKGDGKPFSKSWRPIKGKGRPLSQIVIEEREDRS